MHLTIRLAVGVALCGAIVAAIAGRYDTTIAAFTFLGGVCAMFVSIGIFLFVSCRGSRGVDLTDVAAIVVEIVIRAIRR